MQLIRPEMHPFIAGITLLFLTLVGISGILMLYYGWKSYKQHKKTSVTIIKIVSGVLCLAFVLYNWIGYRAIYTQKEHLIVGTYRCPKAHCSLRINADYTWKMTGNSADYSKTGIWEYQTTEDWSYWNITSENGKYWTQTGSSETITFRELDLTFVKTAP